MSDKTIVTFLVTETGGAPLGYPPEGIEGGDTVNDYIQYVIVLDESVGIGTGAGVGMDVPREAETLVGESMAETVSFLSATHGDGVRVEGWLFRLDAVLPDEEGREEALYSQIAYCSAGGES